MGSVKYLWAEKPVNLILKSRSPLKTNGKKALTRS